MCCYKIAIVGRDCGATAPFTLPLIWASTERLMSLQHILQKKKKDVLSFLSCNSKLSPQAEDKPRKAWWQYKSRTENHEQQFFVK
jgi:hypothetical protein